MSASTPIVCFVGPSNSGKTTLVARVVAELSRRGLRVGALKHSSHQFQMDREGKDTWRYRDAGAFAIGIASANQRALITTTEAPTPLVDLVASLPPGLDFILVEGYKSEGAPKIEVHRGGDPRLTDLDALIATATDAPTELAGTVPHFHIDDANGICDFLLKRRPCWSSS